MIGIQDSQFRDKDKLATAREKHHQQTKRWVEEQFQHACYVENDQTSVANVDRQLGRPITGHELKKIIEEFDPKFKVDWHPFKEKLLVNYLFNNPRPRYNALTRVWEKDEKRRICIAEGGMVPEFSVMGKKEEMRPSMFRHLQRDDEEVKQQIPWREEVRGWRTVLAILVNHGLVSSEQADRTASRLSSQSRESWQALMGKSSRATSPF